MFVVHYIYTPCSKIQIATLAGNPLSPMAACDTSQTTPVQNTHVFVLCFSTQIEYVYAILIPVKVSLYCYMVCIN